MEKFIHKPTEVKAKRLRHRLDLPGAGEKGHGERGDWLIEDVAGDLYVLPDDMFRQLYEPADIRAVEVFAEVLDGRSA